MEPLPQYYFVFTCAGAVLVIDREQNAAIAECQNSFQASKIVDALNLTTRQRQTPFALALTLPSQKPGDFPGGTVTGIFKNIFRHLEAYGFGWRWATDAKLCDTSERRGFTKKERKPCLQFFYAPLMTQSESTGARNHPRRVTRASPATTGKNRPSSSGPMC